MGWRWGEGEGVLFARNFLILMREGKVWRDVGRVLDAKERREAEDRALEEADDDKDDAEKDKGGGPERAPLEYYDSFSDSDGVGAALTIVFRDDSSGADY